MTVYDDHIEAAGRNMRASVTFGDGSNPLLNGLACDVSITRGVADTPAAVSQTAGVVTMQATVTLKAASVAGRALQVSPFSNNANSMQLIDRYGIGMAVTIYEGVYPSGFSGSSQQYPLFTGRVRSMAPADDGTVQVLCQDQSASIQGSANLPAAGGSKSATGVDTRLNPLAVIDLALRSGGYYLTPAVDPAATLSVSGVGGYLPEVGGFLSHGSTWRNLPSPWPTQLPTVDVCTSGSFTATQVFSNPLLGTPPYFKGWFYGSRPVSGTVEWANFGGLAFTVSSTGVLSLTGPGGVVLATSAGALPAGADAWHSIRFTGTWLVDGVVNGTTTSTPGTDVPTAVVTVSVPVLSFQAANGLITSDAAFTPNFTAYLDSIPQRLSGIAPQTGPGWELVQQLAKAYGDVAFWDSSGAFHYETRATWRARRIAAPARTITNIADPSDRLLSGVPQWAEDSLRRSVSVPVVVPVTARSTAAAPAWVATEVYTVPAHSTQTWNIDLDYSIFDVKPFLGGFQTDANSSWIYAVNVAGYAGDPSQQGRAVGVTPTVVPTSSGFTLTLKNPLSFAVAVWSPGDGGSIPAGPYLVVHGTTVKFPESRTLTLATGATSGDDLTVDSNVWRQDDVEALNWAVAMAGDLRRPQMDFPALTIPADPRLEVGKVLSVRDSRHMDYAHPVQIVGISTDCPAEDRHVMTLQVKACYPPKPFWVLGVPGRSELASTTVI